MKTIFLATALLLSSGMTISENLAPIFRSSKPIIPIKQIFPNKCPNNENAPIVLAGQGWMDGAQIAVINLPCIMPDTQYAVTATADNPLIGSYVVIGKTTTQFVLKNVGGTPPAGNLEWIAVHNQADIPYCQNWIPNC